MKIAVLFMPIFLIACSSIQRRPSSGVVDSELSFKNDYIDHLKSLKNLTERRRALNAKLIEWRKSLIHGNGSEESADHIQGFTPFNRLYADDSKYYSEIQQREKFLNEIQSQKIPMSQVAQDFIKSVDSHEILQQSLLCEKALLDLDDSQNDLFLTLHLSARSTFEQVRDRDDLFLRAHQTLRLMRSNYFCQRRISDWAAKRFLAPMQIAKCFASKVKEIESRSNFKVFWSFSTSEKLKVISETNHPKYSVLRPTELEDSLQNFVMSQEDFAVRLENLFAKALALSKGDLDRALRSAYNALRMNRTDQKFQRKLVDLLGDRILGGDNSGNWYHFFGTMRVRLAFGNSANTLAILYRNFGFGAEGADFTFNFSDDDEDAVDLAGLETMRILERLIKTPAMLREIGDSSRECQFSKMNPKAQE